MSGGNPLSKGAAAAQKRAGGLARLCERLSSLEGIQAEARRVCAEAVRGQREPLEAQRLLTALAKLAEMEYARLTYERARAGNR